MTAIIAVASFLAGVGLTLAVVYLRNDMKKSMSLKQTIAATDQRLFGDFPMTGKGISEEEHNSAIDRKMKEYQAEADGI